MRKLIFGLALLLTSNAFAATGTGHAQTELSQPLVIQANDPINFGVIAIDPAAGPQSFDLANPTCPTGYVCYSTNRKYGNFIVRGAPNTGINISIEGETATVSDGNGNTITVDPLLGNNQDTWITSLPANGNALINVSGIIYFTGNEPGGSYSSTNAGGSGYQVTVNY